MKWLSKAETLARLETAARCAMCDALALPAVGANDHAVAVLDRYASRPGHVLVVLRRHVEHLAELAWPDYAAMQQLAWQVARALDRVLAPRRIYIAALGSATQLPTSFPHVHLHVVPLADGGEADRPANVFTWENGMYVFESDAEEHALRAQLCELLERP